jgi:hypothetical protein
MARGLARTEIAEMDMNPEVDMMDVVRDGR